ncbi:MAG TPA: hypothetical protein VKY92_28180, partial [Verrucomicrobiae bacterium]|nr:hypothetical protein [Verrucomicrobiae bacterium]
MSEAKKETATPANVPVRFQHQRAGYFRAIHADGVWGALSNTSNIHLSFYNERPPIPNAVIQELGPDGQWVRDTMRTEPPTDVSIV